ncbi:hypothetical protein ACTQ5F_08205 [Jeotgalibaca porci]|uniref:hypothetical protein n=1 Tax=Jeotgalibaca porci TaxID=1868793 RepID=UPI003F92D0AC
MISDTKKRIEAFDIAKGISILAVMNVHMAREYRLFNTGITFHIAAFFVISGILYEIKPEKNKG